MASRLRWLTVLLAAALFGEAAADDPRPLSQCIRAVWTYRDGLPHNFVRRLLAARTGYLWIGTQEGLVRFDGARFRVFARQDTPGLAGNEINALLEDDRGTLWIGTSHGLSRQRGEGFEIVDLGGEAAVTALAGDGEGGVWAGTRADGLRHLRAGGAGQVERAGGLPFNRITTLQRGSDGALWIGSHRGGLARLAGGRVEVLGGLPADIVRAILDDGRGTIWVGTAGGLARRRPGATTFERVASVGDRDVLALQLDRQGELWVGSANALLRIRGERVEAVAGTGSPSDVQALAEDSEGNLWVGSATGGLQRLRWGQVVTIAREEGLSSDVVWAVREGRGGVIWAGTDGGLDRVVEGRPQAAHAEQLRGRSVASLLEDQAGDLWVGTDGGGLVRFGPRGAVRYGDAEGLTESLVRVVHQDSSGTIRVGTRGGAFRMSAGRFRALARDPDLSGDVVSSIEELPDGSLWVGTGSGLARIEGDRLVPALIEGRPDRTDVTTIHADPDGSLWIGTVGEGLARLRGGRLERWTRRQGLHEDTVLAVLDDGLGHLWLSGNRGITRVRRSELEEVLAGRRDAVAPTVFGTADGMRERECNGGVQPVAWRASDGRLWFATIRGAVVVDPARVWANPQPPPVRIEELVVDGQPRSPGGSSRLGPGTRRVDIHYTGLALAAADRIRFRHRLEGLEDAFFDAGGERVARYTNLGPGRYVFRVVAANENGLWGTQGASLAFEIEPYLWQTAWFQVGAVVAALAAALGAVRLRTRGLRRREVELTARVEEELRREAELAARVEEEMRKVKILAGLLPICAWCKKIRDEGGAWHRLESYVSSRTQAKFTHSICPDCYAREGGGEEGEG